MAGAWISMFCGKEINRNGSRLSAQGIQPSKTCVKSLPQTLFCPQHSWVQKGLLVQSGSWLLQLDAACL